MIKEERTAYELARTDENLHEKVAGKEIERQTSQYLTNEEKNTMWHEEHADKRAAVEDIYKRAEQAIDVAINKDLAKSLIDKIRWLNEKRVEVKNAIQALGTGMPDDETFYNYYKWISSPEESTTYKEGEPGLEVNCESSASVHCKVEIEPYMEIGCRCGGGNDMQFPQGSAHYTINDDFMSFIEGYYTNALCLKPQTYDSSSDVANQFTKKINNVDIRDATSPSYQLNQNIFGALTSSSSTGNRKGFLTILCDYDYVYNNREYSLTNQPMVGKVVKSWNYVVERGESVTPADITNTDNKSVFKFCALCEPSSVSATAWTSLTIRKISVYFGTGTGANDRVLLQEFNPVLVINRDTYQLTQPYMRIFVKMTVENDFVDTRPWIFMSGGNLSGCFWDFLNMISNQSSYLFTVVAGNNALWSAATVKSPTFYQNSIRFINQELRHSGNGYRKIIKNYAFKTSGTTGTDKIPTASYPNGCWLYMASSAYGANANSLTMKQLTLPDSDHAYCAHTMNYYFNATETGGGGGGGSYVPTPQDTGDKAHDAFTPNADHVEKTPEQVEEKIESLPTGTSTAQEKIVEFVFSKVGKVHYSQNSTLRKGPDYYDCSSLAYYACLYAGIDISGYDTVMKNTSKYNCASAEACELYNAGKTFTDRSQLLPGDLVFYVIYNSKTKTYGQPGRFMRISHVAIYVGDGMIVDMSSTYDACMHREIDSNHDIVLYGRPWG